MPRGCSGCKGLFGEARELGDGTLEGKSLQASIFYEQFGEALKLVDDALPSKLL